MPNLSNDEEIKIKELKHYFKDEELNEELKRYLDTDTTFPCIQHPYVYSIYIKELRLNGQLNRQLEYKKKAVKEAFNKQNWVSYIFLHERPYRLHAFITIKTKLNDTDYWKFLSSVFSDSENIWQNLKSWCSLLNSKKKNQISFMDDKDLEVYNRLPDYSFYVYRGCFLGLNDNGLSYTLNKDVANMFSRRPISFDLEQKGIKGIVIKRKITKGQVFAYLDREAEIILKPKFLKKK